MSNDQELLQSNPKSCPQEAHTKKCQNFMKDRHNSVLKLKKSKDESLQIYELKWCFRAHTCQNIILFVYLSKLQMRGDVADNSKIFFMNF